MSEFDFSVFGSVNYGTTALQLVGYEVREEAIVKDGFRTGIQVTVIADCHLVCTTGIAADYSAQLAAAIADCEIDGRDLVIVGLAGLPEYVLLQATAIAGPFPSLQILKDAPAGPLSKALRLTVKSSQYPPPKDGKNAQVNAFKVKTDTRPDGTAVITTTGEITGVNSDTFFETTTLVKAQAAYPLPGWVFEYSVETTEDVNRSKTAYTLKAIDIAGTLPAVKGGATAAVDGEVTLTTETDEHHRTTTKLEVDLLLQRGNDPVPLVQQMRLELLAQIPGQAVQIMRSTYAVTQVQQTRLRGSWQILSSADRAPLMNFSESLEIEGPDDGWEIKSYPGAQPVVVRRPTTLPRISQSVTAIGVRKFKTTTPKFASNLSRPKVTYTHLNDVEKQTVAHYEMYPDLGANKPDPHFTIQSIDLDQAARPSQDNGFIGGGK